MSFSRFDIELEDVFVDGVHFPKREFVVEYVTTGDNEPGTQLDGSQHEEVKILGIYDRLTHEDVMEKITYTTFINIEMEANNREFES